MIEELGQRDAVVLLRENQIGHLGCVVEGEPYVLPVNYLYDGEAIYIHSLPGLKIQALRQHPKVCLQVEAVQDAYHWRSVIAFGQYEEVTEAQERAARLAALYQRLPHLSPVESKMTRESAAPILFRIRIERITGIIEKLG
jgi:nitroimidazol reductase NimA-like FMN-containing flavoprotein (pyridoxamine 5'-phosphate oxidase superfamily)